MEIRPFVFNQKLENVVVVGNGQSISVIQLGGASLNREDLLSK